VRIPKSTPLIVYSLSLLIAFLLATLFFSDGTDSVNRFLFNSDILYFPTLYKDLFIDDYHLSGWTIPGSPNFFPDMLLYFLLMFITGSVPLTIYLFGIIQFFAILLLFRILLKQVFPDFTLYNIALGNLLISMFFLISFISHDIYLSFLLVSNTYHLGAFVNVLIALVFSITYIKSNSFKYLVFLLILGIISIISDRLFIIMYCAPFASALLIFIRKSRNFINSLYIICTIALMVLIGFVLFDKISHNNTIHVAKAYFNITKEGMHSSWNALFGTLHIYIRQLSFFGWIIILSSLSLLLAILFFFRSASSLWNGVLLNSESGLKQFLNLFFIIFTVAVLFAPILTGGFQGFDTIRYNIFVFYFGLLYMGSVLLYFFNEKKWIKNVVSGSTYLGILGLILFLGIYISNNKPLIGFKKYLNYYPEVAKSVDLLDEKFELKQGVSTYWLGKVATMFSKEGVRVYTVYNEDLVPYSHVGNENWYFETGVGKYDPPVFNFILLQKPVSELALATIEKRVGKIILTEEHGDYMIVKVNDFIYNRNNPFPVPLK